MKKITGISLLLLLIMLAGSCSSIKQFRYMSKTKAPKGTFRTEIPFELHNNLIVIKVKFNDSDKEYEFLLDSGAPTSVIYQQALQDSKAETVMTYKVSDSQGNSVNSDYVMMDLRIGNSLFKDVFAAYSPEPSELVQCIAHDGVIGASMMQTANWQIDFINKKIVISDTKKSSLPDLKEYQKLSFTKRAPFRSMPWLTVLPGMAVKIKVNEKLFKDVWVDLGSSGALSLPKNTVTDTLFKNESKEVLLGYSSFGLFGAVMDTAYYFPSSNVHLDQVQFNKHTITIEKQDRSLLGTAILSDYAMFIDFRKKNMYLKQVVPDESVEEKKLGFYLYYDSKSQKTFVASMFQGSPAELAGLKLNDTIVEINGQPLPVFADFCEFRAWSKKIVSEEMLMIKTEGEDEAVTIKKGVIPQR